MKLHKNNKELYIVSEDVNSWTPALHKPGRSESRELPDIKLCPVKVRTAPKNRPQSEVKDTTCVSVVTLLQVSWWKHCEEGIIQSERRRKLRVLWRDVNPADMKSQPTVFIILTWTLIKFLSVLLCLCSGPPAGPVHWTTC